VEQKNYASVRKIVGYGRYAGEKGVAALDAVYGPYDHLLNYFYPCRKLPAKERTCSKVRKTYDQPHTPFDRALASPGLSQQSKAHLCVRKAALNLMETMELMQRPLDTLPGLADPVPKLVSKRRLKLLRFGLYG
jgi:hypothetical protein